MPSLLHNMLPAVFAALAGFFLSRHRRIDLQTVGSIIIYCISPAVTFGGVIRAEITPATAAMPFAAFLLGSLNSLLAHLWARAAVGGCDMRRFVASSASSANTLYFGMGLAVAALPPAGIPVFLLTCVGFTLSEAVWGYYFLARGAFSVREACARVARLPVLYAVMAGVLWRAAGFGGAELLGPVLDNCKGTLVVLGSMILGLSLGQETRLQFSPKLLLAVLFGRHMTFAALALGLVALDAAYLHVLEPKYYAVLALFACFPIANNTLTFASTLGLPTGPISGAIVASNAFALAVSPVILLLR